MTFCLVFFLFLIAGQCSYAVWLRGVKRNKKYVGIYLWVANTPTISFSEHFQLPFWQSEFWLCESSVIYLEKLAADHLDDSKGLKILDLCNLAHWQSWIVLRKIKEYCEEDKVVLLSSLRMCGRLKEILCGSQKAETSQKQDVFWVHSKSSETQLC